MQPGLFSDSNQYPADCVHGESGLLLRLSRLAAQSGDMETAIKEWLPLAEEGDARAQFNMGVIYHTGQGVETNHDEALKWFLLAAKQGVPHAQNHLGYFFENGFAVTQDYREAAGWYRKAAKQGFWTAQENLGGMYLQGKGVPQDTRRAAVWAIAAMMNGSYRAEALVNEAQKKLPESEIGEAWQLATQCIEENYVDCE